MLNEAQLDLAKTTLARYQALDKTTPGAVSKQALDQYKAAVVEAQARVDAQKKSLEVYKLNKEFTRSRLADRRPGEPLLPDAGKPGQPGPDALDHGRVAGPDVCVFRHG